MLRIIQSTGVARSKNYYSSADYYAEGQELTGIWRGEGARLLDLKGNVEKSDWDALCDNLHPQTGQRLTLRTNSDRTVGYDFNFHVPKSVSLLYVSSRDERLLDAFRDSVQATMQDIESEMSTRVRKVGKNEERKTSNMVWGEYVHFTSRPVDGLPDPHLHAHCFAFNVTHDKQEQAWKAGQFRELMRDAPYYEALFHARLAHRLAELGMPVTRTKKGWELAGIEKGLIDRFSRRTKQIEDLAREKGIEDPKAKDSLGARTRESKKKELSFPELQEVWRGRMTADEMEVLKTLESRIGSDDGEPLDGDAGTKAVEHAIAHEFERKSVVPERRLLATALRHGVGRARVEQVFDAAKRSDLVTGQRNGRTMVTTRGVLTEERRVIDYARKGRGACSRLVGKEHRFRREWLNADQKKAVEHILGSRDRVILVRGSAGVGKTTLMQEAVEAVEANGTKVFAFAPSADASRGTLKESGFANAETVAMLLKNPTVQEQAAGQLIWIDEAGQLGTKTMSELFSLAEKIDARLLLSGDRYQHGSVERGSALRLLEEEAGLASAEVKEIQRQSGEYKAAVKALSVGRAEEGFRRLDALGWVREIDDDQREHQLATDYVSAVTGGKTAVVISPTHREGDRITGEIRQQLRDSGKIGQDERTFLSLEGAGLTEAERGDAVNYLPGDVLQFHQNAKGFTRGQRVTIDGIEPLPAEHAAKFQAFHARTLSLSPGDTVRITHNGFTTDGKHRLNNGMLYRVKRFDERGDIVLDNGWTVRQDYGHLAYGYVITSYASQSKTVDVAFVGQSSQSFNASSREQFYVSASRARQSVTIYTDDKMALRDAIAQTDERLSATEFVNGTAARNMLAWRQLQEVLMERPQPRAREEVSHVR